ncbi:hypothetical protein ACLIJS_12195 [Mammaliicoccus sciuri]|uniref:hypothetical protein n=1 Tax=Mammaliicoccus sciuri TaxID=1296 RepID=UPI00195B1A4A|nr:hypothetical protein [Mammaliicoccus sciuri]MEB7065130.1 hypothetical protein [Mammaliicoccus sciuri]
MEYKIGNKVEIEEDGGKGGGFWTDKINYRSRSEEYGPIKIIIGPKTGFAGR